MLEMYLGYKPWAHKRALTGPLVGVECREYFEKCPEKRPMPEELQKLLAKCLAQDPDDRPRDFAVVESRLKRIYLEKTGSPYSRKEPETASDTAESLNNRALSYLDLGMDDKAEELFKQAINKDVKCFLYHFNYALYLWNRRRINDQTLVEYLKKNIDTSELCKKKMDILYAMRGTWDRGVKLYSYQKDKRPKDLEPLLQPSTTSVDGRYRVTGYEEKDDNGTTQYGYRIENLDTGEIREYPNEYDDSVTSVDGKTRATVYKEIDNHGTTHYGYRIEYLDTGEIREYPIKFDYHYFHMDFKPNFCKSSNAYFIGPKSELVVMEAKTMWIFESRTGRLVLSMPPVIFEDADRKTEYYIVGYTQSGVIEYSWFLCDRVDAIHMRIDETLSYEMAEFPTADTRLRVEKELQNNYEEALSCWNRNDVSGTYRALKRSLEGQLLTMHEPSLRLWSKLREYYEPESLITVVPTYDAPTPLPVRNECKKNQQFAQIYEYRNASNNGQTALWISQRCDYKDDSFKHGQKDMNYCTIIAKDIRSGNSYFSIKDIDHYAIGNYAIHLNTSLIHFITIWIVILV